MLDAALRYADKGWRVFPCHSAREGRCSCGYQCSSPAKHPRTANGLRDASSDTETIEAWWEKWPDANVAVATGNGLVVLDVDEKSGGYESLAELGELPSTPVVTTGGGGVHYYFTGEARTGAGLRPGIDIRGTGGYVVAPPSVHISGRTYDWDILTEELPLGPFPAELANRPTRLSEPGAEAEPVRAGARNATLASLAGTMRRRGMSQASILSALLTENAGYKPPLEEREVEAIAKSVSRYEAQASAVPEIIAKPAPEFLALDIPAPRYLVEGIWPEHGIGFVAGPPKSFKSFLVLDMAFALATGRPFLGYFPVPAPRTVLLIDHESSRGALTERVRKAEERYGEAKTLYIISNRSFSLEDPVDIDRLRLEISAVRPDQTILDPLASFVRGDENSAQQMGMVVRTLRGLRDEFGTGFAIVHHVQKSGAGDTTRGGERMRGSSAFYAAAEVGLWVRRVDEEAPRSVVRPELKDGEAAHQFQVLFDSDHGILQYLDPFQNALQSMQSTPAWRPPAEYDRFEQIEAPYYARD